MEANIQTFYNKDFNLRIVYDDNGQAWAVAKDIAEALEYSYWQSNIVANVPDIWKGIKRINTPGGEQEMLCLTENGVYFFLGRSDKPKALPYQMWIAGEVVPSIRKHGMYATPAIGTLIVSQRLINRAFDIVNFVVSYLEQHRPELDINRPEVSD